MSKVIEIIGERLDEVINSYNIIATKTYQQTPIKDSVRKFQVWEMEEVEAVKLEDVEPWYNDRYGWFRFDGSCIYEGKPLKRYMVNNKNMLGYRAGYDKYSERDNIGESLRSGDEYRDYITWIRTVMGATTDQGMSVITMSMAKDNNMKMSELLSDFQG